MKQKIMKYPKLMLIGLLLVFASCEKDQLQEEEVHEHAHGQNPNEVSMEYFKEVTRIEDVALFVEKNMEATTTLNKMKTYTFSDFQIETEAILQCRLRNGETAFSFFLLPNEGIAQENELFNLVISRIEGEWRSTLYLLTLDPDERNPEKYNSVEAVYSQSGVVAPINTASRFPNGYSITISYHCTNTGKCLREGKCDLCKLCVSRTVTYSFHFDEQEHDSPVFTINEGNTGGGGSSNHNNPPTTTPCEELAKLTNTTATKNALKNLKNNVHLDHETGYNITKNNVTGRYNTPVVANSLPQTPGMIDMPTGGNNIGSFHTHPSEDSGFFPMLNDGDLNYLYWVALKHNNGNQTKNYSEYFLTLTVPEGTFAIKINDWTKFRIFRNSDEWENTQGGARGELRGLRQKFEKIGPDGDINKMKNVLLEILKENDAGVGLYEASEDLTSWNELELSPNVATNPAAEPIKKPCN